MQSREIFRLNWPAFFDRVSAALEGKTIEIEIDSADLGVRLEARKLSLDGLIYDARDDTLFIVTEVLEHAIPGPRRILVTDGDAGMQCLQILAADGSKQVVRFSEPLPLPPAAHA